jgi:hypothetical protein
MLKPKRVIDEPDLKTGICVWRFPDGTYLQDHNGNYLSAGPAMLNNTIVERRMEKAARACGATSGSAFWLPGFRKITHSEWEDQMERLIDGKIPDVVDLYRQTGEA